MTQINIYTKKINYRRLLKQTNLYFENKYVWYRPLTVFAPYAGKYLVSINKGNIRLCYWDENTKEGENAKKILKKYIIDTLSNSTIGIDCSENCDFFSDINTIKTIRI